MHLIEIPKRIAGVIDGCTCLLLCCDVIAKFIRFLYTGMDLASNCQEVPEYI